MSVKKPEIPEPGESGGIAAPPGPYLLSMQKVRPVTTLGAGLAQLACQNLHVLTVEARKSATGRSGLYPESCKGSQAERGPEDVIPTATLGSRCPQRRCRLSWASNQADGLVFSNVSHGCHGQHRAFIIIIIIVIIIIVVVIIIITRTIRSSPTSLVTIIIDTAILDPDEEQS